MKNHTRLLIVICIIGLIVAVISAISSDNVNTVPNDVTQSTSTVPVATTTVVSTSSVPTPVDISSQVDISVPKPNNEVRSPFTVSGRLRGGWFFEANAGLAVLDENKQPITVSNIQATSDWMTSDWVTFTGTTSYPMAYKGKSGYVQISNDNPSGLPENSKSYLIPVLFR